MKAAQVSKPGGNFEIVERPIPEPGRAQVRIKVEACGVCHSDVHRKGDRASPDCNTRAFPATRLPGASTQLGLTSRNGSPASGWASAGMAGTALSATPAVAAISFFASSRKLPASATTAATRNM